MYWWSSQHHVHDAAWNDIMHVTVCNPLRYLWCNMHSRWCIQIRHNDQVYLLEFARWASLKKFKKNKIKLCLNINIEESKSVFNILTCEKQYKYYKICYMTFSSWLLCKLTDPYWLRNLKLPGHLKSIVLDQSIHQRTK